jgi:hypothetical protein
MSTKTPRSKQTSPTQPKRTQSQHSVFERRDSGSGYMYAKTYADWAAKNQKQIAISRVKDKLESKMTPKSVLKKDWTDIKPKIRKDLEKYGEKALDIQMIPHLSTKVSREDFVFRLQNRCMMIRIVIHEYFGKTDKVMDFMTTHGTNHDLDVMIELIEKFLVPVV